MVCCLALMNQAAVLNGLCLEFLPFCQDCGTAPEVSIGRRQIAEAFVISAVDEGGYRRFEFALQGVIFEGHAFLLGLVPVLELALRLGMVGGSAHVSHAVLLEISGEIARDVTEAVLTEPLRLVQHRDAVISSCGLPLPASSNKNNLAIPAAIDRAPGGAAIEFNRGCWPMTCVDFAFQSPTA